MTDWRRELTYISVGLVVIATALTVAFLLACVVGWLAITALPFLRVNTSLTQVVGVGGTVLFGLFVCAAVASVVDMVVMQAFSKEGS